MIALYRARPLQSSESKWVYSCLDQQVGLQRGKDFEFVESVAEALTHPVIFALGADSYTRIIGNNMAVSEVSIVGKAFQVGEASAIFTWDLGQAMQDPAKTQEFVANALYARMFAYGLGNRNTGYVSSLKVSDGKTDTIFSMERLEDVIRVFRS